MHAAARRSRRAAVLGVIAAVVALLVIAAPASPASAKTVRKGAVPKWVVKKCRTGTVICINKTTRKLVYMKKGKAILRMDARFGDAYNPTREGTFTVYWKHANHVSTLYGSAMPYSMFFSGGEAIHYSSDFKAYGYAHHSHGCVNIRDYNGMKWLYNHVPQGTKVVVYH